MSQACAAGTNTLFISARKIKRDKTTTYIRDSVLGFSRGIFTVVKGVAKTQLCANYNYTVTQV